MNAPVTVQETPFPMRRPDVTITPKNEPVFDVDWRELGWWFAVPELGDRTLWAVYYPPEWLLSEYVDMAAVGPALVHEIECVEIAAHQYSTTEEEPLGGGPWTFFARITEDRVQYLANLSIQGGKRRLYTLLDEGFDEDWGDSQRAIRRTGRFEQQPDGSCRQFTGRVKRGDRVEPMGVCEVTIGGQAFSCLRVIDVEPLFSEGSILMEGFLTREGRTILCRRYNGRHWHRQPGGAKPPWDEEFPHHDRIVIDGVTFVHWYDCLSDRACGIDPDTLPPFVPTLMPSI